MITSHPAAIAYANQRGIATIPGPQVEIEGTVPELYAKAKELGLPVTTKTKKPALIVALSGYNHENAAQVDTEKLTAAQRRRLRTKYGVVGA